MNLQEKQYFYFTQNSLNTFKSCPFRFQKIYMDNIKWNEEKNLDIEQKIDFGIDFHKLAERYFMGIPNYEAGLTENHELYKAFLNLKESFPIKQENVYYPEYTLRVSDEFMRLEANIDLLIINEDKSIEIWDWKTNAKLNNFKKYLSSLQTAVYMLVLKKSVHKIFGFDVPFEKIKMTYFSPEKNEIIASLNYSEEQYKKDEKEIKSLIKKVYTFDYGKFNREKYIKSCKYCEFSLFCDNQKTTEKTEFALNWNDIESFA